jgi:Domain of unknown function (DUF4129)
MRPPTSPFRLTRRTGPVTPPDEVRPRSLSEILDDAAELALADAPALLAMLGLFQLPAFALFLFLAARPALPGVEGVLLAALCVVTLALTGIGSGACQEWFRRRSAGTPPRLLPCLSAALQRGIEHTAARAVTLVSVALGLVLFGVPGFLAWCVALTVHAAIASGAAGAWIGLSVVIRDTTIDAGKASLIVLLRPVLVLLAMVNLHVVAVMVLWTAGNMIGLEVSFWWIVLQLGNPAYLLALGLLAWYLVSPFHEAVNFLLHADRRTRQDGLDLLVRVRRAFGGSGRRTMVALLIVFLGMGELSAQEQPGERRLTRDQIKQLLRKDGSGIQDGKQVLEEQPRKKEQKNDPRNDDAPRPQHDNAGPALPAAAMGFGFQGLFYTAIGIAVAVLVVALVFVMNQPPSIPETAKPTVGALGPAPEPLPHEQPALVWWRQADEAARSGRHRDAVRAVYQAVLSLLHERSLIRCEVMRTNGEYVTQVTLSPRAGQELAEMFGRLTNQFESFWYGSDSCDAADYRTCRNLGEEVRDLAC